MSKLKSKLRQLIRNFPQNGIKLMMETPANVRELLAVFESRLIAPIDFAGLRLVKHTFVKRDYRHVESDVVLIAPLRRAKGRGVRHVLVYILIEHQSKPDRLMLLRVLDYVVQIFNFQVREWAATHPSFAGIRLCPVLPVVFYTGTRRWDSLGKLADVVERHEFFEPVLPMIEPLYLSLRDVPAAKLEGLGGYFGRVLRLVQQRKARLPAFRELLEAVVKHLEGMSASERMRWLELLSYLHALIYHEREADEIPVLEQTIESAVARDEYRREVSAMAKSYAQVLEEKGREEGIEKGIEKGKRESAVATRQETLCRLLTKKFGRLPRRVSNRIQSTDDILQLDAWLDSVVTAGTLEQVGI